jgi:hypothetical protein
MFWVFCFGLVTAALQEADAKQAETKKIEALISHVEGLKNAKFIRNGVEYDAGAAGQFLRGKWKVQESEIKTAKDFIEKVATKSSTSGKAYLIRVGESQPVESGHYLAKELEKIESSK